MTYTKTQLEAHVQTLSEVLEAFDVAHFERMWFTQQWTRDYRQELYNKLVAARKALAEAESDPSPYAPSEAYLNALRSFGLTDEQCVEELRRARECAFSLLLAEEKRKAYDLGDSQGYSKGYDRGKADGQVLGYANGLTQGKIDGDWTGYARGHAIGHDRGYRACALDHEIELVEP